MGDVHRHGLLATIGAGEIGGDARITLARLERERGAPCTRIVSALRTLDLDHLGAHIGQELGCPGSGKDTGQVEDTDVGQWSRHEIVPYLNFVR